MENPAFLESDHSVYESILGTPPAIMSQRRPRHLPALHHHSISASRGIAAAAHIHNGRVVGITGLPGGQHGFYHDSVLSSLYPSLPQVPATSSTVPHHSEPMYSCQAPRGHEHVYQCPGHADTRKGSLNRRHPDHMDYHYGGSDYSSTEPIYAQPHLFPHEGTPSLNYANSRSSLRNIHSSIQCRGDITQASTSSSTLPTVSALFTEQGIPPRLPPSSPTGKTPLKSINVSAPPPIKLKRQGLFDSWKFLRGIKGKQRACALIFTCILVLLSIVAAVLYLTLGGGFGSLSREAPKLIEVTETGSNIVNGEFLITNHNFLHGLSDAGSHELHVLSRSLEAELDALFLRSMWAPEYNSSEVVDITPGSVVLVHIRLLLNTPDVSAAQKFSSAFLRGLRQRHGYHWLGRYSIDVSSIRFDEVLVDTPSETSSAFPPLSPRPTVIPSTVLTNHVHQRPTPHLNVGWGEWGAWSKCDPCSPLYDQVRTRQCRLDSGRGLLINSIEPCLPSGGDASHLQGAVYDTESRPCQCTDQQSLVRESDSQATPSTSSAAEVAVGADEPEWGVQKIDVENEEEPWVCNSCAPGEVCVGLQGEPFPTCRTPKDSSDPTGCGGLCTIDTEVCQALGSRSFQCHSASQCLQDEWRCADGLCIPFIKRCDGHMNCYDNSDELHCECGANFFHCGNKTSCLPAEKKCDGKVDCWDGSDEVSCTSTCPSDTQFTCLSGQCIAKQRFCDRLQDCTDGSDEPLGCTGHCQAHEFGCRNGRCIPAVSLCDGRNTCGDNSDEQNCNRTLFFVSQRKGTPFVNDSQPSENPSLDVFENSGVAHANPDPSLYNGTIERGWRRTAALIPKLEDFLEVKESFS